MQRARRARGERREGNTPQILQVRKKTVRKWIPSAAYGSLWSNFLLILLRKLVVRREEGLFFLTSPAVNNDCDRMNFLICKENKIWLKISHLLIKKTNSTFDDSWRNGYVCLWVGGCFISLRNFRRGSLATVMRQVAWQHCVYYIYISPLTWNVG